MVAGLKKATGRVHVNEEKSCFLHTCDAGEGVRQRRHKTEVLVAAPSPVRGAMKFMSAEALEKTVAASGLEPPSHKRAQHFTRLEHSTSWEQYVTEMHHLPQFLAEMKEKDPLGTYLCEDKPDIYNEQEIRAFQRYFVSWGAASRLLQDTPMLYLIAVDGGHMKCAFGGVCLAAVVVTANSKLFPAAWAVVDAENEANCLWFFQQVLKALPGIDFVWMTDQGTALTCDSITKLLDDNDQYSSLCAKHIIKTLEVARAKKEISGAMSGVRELIYRFARARTVEWGDSILAEIEKKSRDVAVYLRERRDSIEAAAFLRQERKRGGRITSQMVESFFNMCLPFREKGLVDGIIWMCQKFQSVQLQERELLMRWQSGSYTGVCIPCLSHASTAKLLELVGQSGPKGVFKLTNSVFTDLQLSADVTKVSDGTCRRVVITRAEVGAKMKVACPCLMREEHGLPCARAIFLLIKGGWCTGTLPVECVAEFRTSDAWSMHCAIDIFCPAIPTWLAGFKRTTPVASFRTVLEDGPLKLFPGRIPVPAGRPKLVKRIRKAFNSHFARLKSGTEKGDGKKGRKADAIDEADCEDEVIVFDGELELPIDVEDDGEAAKGPGPAEQAVASPVAKVVSCIDDLFWTHSKPKTTVKAEAKCASCGGTGHKWPKCRSRNIELMLVTVNAMPAGALLPLLPAPVAAVMVAPAVAPTLLALLSTPEIVILADGTEFVIPAAAVVAVDVEAQTEPPRKGKRGRPEPVVTCIVCKNDAPYESFRHFGEKCKNCKISFWHFKCAGRCCDAP